MNVSDLITGHARKKPDAEAFYFKGGAFTYAQVDRLIWSAAGLLHGNGVKSGDVVAHIFNDEMMLSIVMLAMARLGATVFSVPVATPELVREEMLSGVRACHIVTDIERFPSSGLPKSVVSMKGLFAIETVDESIRDDEPEAPWLIMSGSGTTGKPKMLPLKHTQMMSKLKFRQRVVPVGENDRVVSLMHLDFPGTKRRFMGAMYSGAAYLFFNRRKTAEIELVTTYGSTVMYGTVFHVEHLLRRWLPKYRKYYQKLNVLEISASIVTDDLRERIVDKITPNLYVWYGTNEFSPIAIYNAKKMPSVPMTVGPPVEGVSVELVDEEGKAVPMGTMGRVRVKAPGMIDGYLYNEEATRKSFKEGWFHTGDLAVMNEQGDLIYYGREDHMLIFDGINIYPSEIETVMSEHDAVIDAAVIPVKDPVHQDIPLCAVVVDGRDVTDRELMDFASKRLGVRMPRKIVQVEAIPRNQRGKLERDELDRLVTEQIALKRRQAGETVLVMFSGGIDSTYLLYHYLVNTDYRLHVHHISMRYPSEPRWKEEDIASRKIVEACRKIRAFDYSESRFDFGFYSYVGRDSDTQLLIASKIIGNIKGPVALALGWNYSDHRHDLRNGRAANRVTETLWETLCDGMDASLAERVDREIQLPILRQKLTKDAIIKRLPEALLDLTWSCRKPVKGKDGISRNCGKCAPCREIAVSLKKRS
jgi:acyl-coenzyme A synthetase/AMP-(fatty) acid ligase